MALGVNATKPGVDLCLTQTELILCALTPKVESSVPHMDVFEQLNVASSRKQMAPALDAYFAL